MIYFDPVSYFNCLHFFFFQTKEKVNLWECVTNILAQNRSNRILYTALYRTYDCKIEVRCSYGFGQTALHCAVLKIAQNHIETHR